MERILNHRRHGRSRQLQYFIKWKGYPESDNMWEPADQVHAPDLLKAYHRSNPLVDKRKPATAVNHIPPFYPTRLPQLLPSPCLPKVPPTLVAKTMLPSRSHRLPLPSPSPPRHSISFSATFPISMSSHLGGYWAELSVPCGKTRRPTIARRCAYASRFISKRSICFFPLNLA